MSLANLFVTGVAGQTGKPWQASLRLAGRSRPGFLLWMGVLLLLGDTAHAQGVVTVAMQPGQFVYDVDTITKLNGGLVQLYAGSSATTLTAVGSPVPVTAGAFSLSGYFTVPGVPPGGAVYAKLKAWRAADGASYEAASTGGGDVGVSALLATTAGNPLSPPAPPFSQLQFSSFSLLGSLVDVDVARVGGIDTPGTAWNVAASGNYVFVADGDPGVQVVDVSDVTNPQVIGSYNTTNVAYDVAVNGNLAYVADGSAGLQILDVSNPASPAWVGGLDTTGTARGVAVNGAYAYIADDGQGLRVIDVSNPASPALLGTYNTSGLAWSVAVSGNYAFVADATAGLQIINVSVPSAPSFTSVYNTPGYALAVAVRGDYAFVADGDSGLQVLNVSNPASPTLVGSYDTGGYAYDVALLGDYACVADYGGHFLLINVSNPAAPERVGGHHTYGRSLGVAVNGGYAFMADEGAGLQIFDVEHAVRSNPQRLGYRDTVAFVNSVAAAGNYAFLAADTNGLVIVDISDPSAPSPVGSYNTTGFSLGVAVRGNYAYVADWTTGLEVFDISNPASPVRVGGIDTTGRAYGVALGGNYAYVADDTGGLKVIDVSNPASPLQVGAYPTTGRAAGVAVNGSLLYLADRSAGLYILDVSDPTAPQLVGSIVSPAFSVAVSGTYACLARGSPGLEIVDVSDPANPQSVGFCATGGYAYGVSVSGSYAYVADWGSGLQVIDIGNPANPRRVGGNSARDAYAVTLNSGRIYVAAGYEGLSVLEAFDVPNAPPILNLVYSEIVSVPSGPSPIGVARGDFDGDGRVDIVTAHGGDGSVMVLRNNSTGTGITLVATPMISTGDTTLSAMQSADLNGDHKPDLAVISGASGSAAVRGMINTSTGPGSVSFSAPVVLSGTPDAVDMALIDVDRDGLVDIILAEGAAQSVAVLRNTSVGGVLAFDVPVRQSLGVVPRSITAGDLDGDGKVDLVMAQPTNGTLAVLANTSSGAGVVSFAPAFTLAAGPRALGAVVGDLDGDGRLDLMVPDEGAASVSLFRNISTPGALNAGSFEARVVVDAEAGAKRMTLVDYDRDGKPDLAVTSARANRLALWRNKATPGELSAGDFEAGAVLITGQAPGQPMGIDLDLDGRTDLVAPNAWDDTLSVFHNQASQYSPLGALPGQLQLTVSDDSTATGSLVVGATSSNPDLLTVAVTGSGASRTLEFVSAPGASGVVTVSVTVDDGAGGVTSQQIRLYLGCPANTSWPYACDLALAPPGGALRTALVHQSLEAPDEARWYRFAVEPGSRAVITLTGLVEDYDLFLFRDIQAVYNEILTPTTDDLVRLGAEFAPTAFSPTAFSEDALAPTAFSPTAFSPTAFSPTAFSPTAFSPTAFSPTAFSPTAFSPTAFSPTAFSPTAFSPTAFSPTAFSPTAFSPTAFSPTAFSPTAFSPTAFSPTAFSPTAFSGAQVRSLIGISAFAGTAGEGIYINTWDNTGDFYVCVRGRNGAYAAGVPYLLQVALLSGACGAVNPLAALPPSDLVMPAPGPYATLILTDPSRMQGTATEKTEMINALAAFAARPEIGGAILDVGTDARVRAANLQADAHTSCIFAKNQVAEAIRQLVLNFRGSYPGLQNIVLVGNDNTIPFFRHWDNAGLGNERNYVPPVLDETASQASLREGQLLSQDAYGAICSVTINGSLFPIPDLAVGRLVEQPSEITALLQAYPAASQGVLPTPTSSIVVGYDFLLDAARAIGAEFRAGIGVAPGTVHDELLAVDPLQPDAILAPFDERAWTAVDLREALLGRRHDLIFLAGHFSAGNALAADWTTELTAGEIAAARADLVNAIVIGAGCHVGYNIVDPHGVPGVTREPDWAQAFANQRVGAFVGGTGYQYGDTEFIEYNERLYLELARQLRMGSGPVAVGKALVAAKRKYLAETPLPREIHEKAVLQATLFGLPMLSVNLPLANRLPAVPEIGLGIPATPYAGISPGAVLGLSRADLSVSTPVSPEIPVRLAIYPQPLPAVPLDPANFVDATYVTSGDGLSRQVSYPAEPVLPLITTNVSVSGAVLRGVGFRGGSYALRENILPLTGAPGTEIRGVSMAFESDTFWPVLPWSVNYFDALCGGSDAGTRLSLFPAQYRSSGPASLTGTRRVYQALRFRLFYSANTSIYTEGSYQSIPSLAAPPAISDVQVTVVGSSVQIQARVVGTPEAGIQEVWVTHTQVGVSPGVWEALDLVQDPVDSRIWGGTMTGVTAPADLRFIVHAVNGVGLVSSDAHLGGGYTPQTAVQSAATLSFVGAVPATGYYSDSISITAQLHSGVTPIAGEAVEFSLGSQRLIRASDGAGLVTVVLPFADDPGSYALQASFAGSALFESASVSTTVQIEPQPTLLQLTAVGTDINRDVTAVLTDPEGHGLAERSVFFLVTDAGGAIWYSVSQITDSTGLAALGAIPLDPGLAGTTYTIRAYFNGEIPLAGSPTMPTRTTTLVDSRYQSSTAALAVFYRAQACTVSYTGEVVVPATGTLHLSAVVDAPGQDLTLALIEFTLLNSQGMAVPGGELVVPVAPDGLALGSISGLVPEVYEVVVRVVGGSFTVLPADQPPATTVAVYDPTGGFVTGAGWINSPAGAFRPVPSLTGKAVFGFTSKFEKKSTVPTGRTAFRFQVGDLDFQSTSYQWLTVSGAKAKFKGVGTINGVSGYTFLVSTIDGALAGGGGSDKFRIKIWQTVNGVVVYDNEFGTSEAADPSTLLGGGSIIIHKQ